MSLPEEPESRLLQPGRNCCAVRSARRASVLVDAADYLARLDEVLRRAERSIFIIGWDFDAGIRLRPDEPGSPRLGDLLRRLVEERPSLEVRILVWNLSTVHTPGASLPLILGAEWQTHPRIQLWLDHNHPIYGSQHQKLVCVDDSVAFVGGIDLTIDRWDTREHLPDHPLRTLPDGTPYGPVHDLHMIVEGEAARAVASVARHRWRRATDEMPEDASGDRDIWPPDLPPDFADVPVGISRTMPASGGDPEVREIRALIGDALAAARHTIYMEAQYFAEHSVGDVLEAGLARETGPEIVVVTPRSEHGILERWIMSSNRNRLIRRLKRADRFDRFRVLYPVVVEPEGDCEIFVHSKTMIVDDRLLRIGSANLNRRSSGLDTECDLVIEAHDKAARAAIVRIRNSLLAEHLGVTEEEVTEALDREGSLVRIVDTLKGGARRLRAFDTIRKNGPVRPIFGTRLLDPSKPFPLMLRKRAPTRHAPKG